MKKILVFAFVALLPMQSAFAFYSWGFPPTGKEYQPPAATEAFLVYEDGIQTMVIKSEWQGSVKDFGIVYPTPSKPEVTAGPVELFWQLEEATNPWVELPQAVPFAESVARDAKTTAVEVVEEKQVADYKVTVLKASSASELTKWLKKNGYNYDADDTAKIDYYVKQKNFYFVALKIDASKFTDPIMQPMYKEASLDDSVSNADEKMAIAPNWFWGELSPIQISFATDKPQLPMRTLKSDMSEMVFDLYTMSDKAVYIPGVDTVYSNLVDNEFVKKVPAIMGYSPKGKWLLRQEVRFIPSKSDADVYLEQATTEDFATVSAGKQVRFNPKALNSKTGIIAGVRGQVVATDGTGKAYTFTRSLKVGSVGEDVRELQKILNAEGFTIAKSGPGAPGSESTYFGPATKMALIKYQNYYRSDVLTPFGLTAGTGYFGPATMKFMNR
jgi:Uncharacterized protein conserved in bacteria (DUF2330)/Putative peptidoglycan binding domain